MSWRDTRDPNPATRAQKWKQISEITFRLAVGLVIVGMVIANVVLVERQSNGQARANATLENTQDVKHALRILINCTSPGHGCYERGNRRTAQAVSQLGRISVLASSCAANLPVPSPTNVEHCVLAHLK